LQNPRAGILDIRTIDLISRMNTVQAHLARATDTGTASLADPDPRQSSLVALLNGDPGVQVAL
jgi:hypothetical protein